MKHYELGIGSVAGHADIMPFVKATSEEATTDPGQPLMLQEGHSYYITIKVWRMTRVMMSPVSLSCFDSRDTHQSVL